MPRCMVGIRAMHCPKDPMNPKVTATHGRPWDKKFSANHQIDGNEKTENIAVVHQESNEDDNLEL